MVIGNTFGRRQDNGIAWERSWRSGTRILGRSGLSPTPASVNQNAAEPTGGAARGGSHIANTITIMVMAKARRNTPVPRTP